MDKASIAQTYQFGDQTTSDITIHLRSGDGKPEVHCCHKSILIENSKFFADRLSVNQSGNYIEVSCPVSDYENYIKLLKLLYFPQDSVLDLLDSVESAVGVIRASIALRCEAITESCIRYLEAMPWEEKEEEEIYKILPILGLSATPLLMRFQQPDFTATKNVFISAIRLATTIDRSFPPFTDELRMSAQEQVDYMLAEDEETPLVAADEDVKSTAQSGLANMFSTLETELRALPLSFSQAPEAAEQRVLQCLSDLDWMCNILPKMELMKEFVLGLAHISDYVLAIVQDEKYDYGLWGVKFRLVELVGKALEAVGFGSVVLPSASRVQFLKTWLPYLRKMKPVLDSKSAKNEAFPYRMDVDLCQNIEGAIVSLVLALPSCDQAEILSDWMERTEQLKFPDLTEAFEVWCYRTKAAKRRLVAGFNGVSSNPTRSQPLMNP